MKKTTTKTLSLRTQTLRVIAGDQLGGVVGGTLQPVAQGFIMQDSKIVPTSRR